MIGQLRGQVTQLTDSSLILDVSGVGYLVQVPYSVIQKAQLNQDLTLSIHTSVREDAITLYGFSSSADKQLFELLVSVSGIGPKIGLSILSTYTAAQIETAITTGQVAAFTAVSGIGKKNAERIILELKTKVAPTSLTADMTPAIDNDQLTQALAGLGYTGAEVAVISQQIDGQLPITEQIKQALKLIGQQQ